MGGDLNARNPTYYILGAGVRLATTFIFTTRKTLELPKTGVPFFMSAQRNIEVDW